MRQREFVAFGAEAADRTNRQIAKVRVVAEGFPRMHVGQVYLYEGNSNGRKGISQRYAGMRESCWIEDNEIDIRPGAMNFFNEFGFGVALKAI